VVRAAFKGEKETEVTLIVLLDPLIFPYLRRFSTP